MTDTASVNAARKCNCGWPEPLHDGPYEGEVIAEIGGKELRQLTEHELRHSGTMRYALMGATHWLGADHFKVLAVRATAHAAELSAAHDALVKRGVLDA